ncbi:hypothetical protein JZM39_04735 [Acinetobacter pittii]|uniref:hypothetical protein n=1 Tax=Acinetobacter pittii TaxID=48296 RepID=UPI00197FBD36|nr:hypothetical protein [Acinetobacter pittii]MBN6535080.1 hypothetical protein [Acinetobacter pittii]
MTDSHLKKIFKLTPISEVSLHRNLIGTFTCILAFSLLIYILIIYPLDGDKASSLASMFSFSATLFAPIAALFLLDSWKAQAIYNEKKEHADTILEVLSILKYSLIEKIDTINGLKKVKEFAVINNLYYGYNNNDDYITSELFKKSIHIQYFKDNSLHNINDPLSFYSDLERHHSYISMYFSQILYKYSKYYEYLKEKLSDDQLNYNHNFSNKSYNILNINPDFYLKDSILLMLSFQAGFKVRENEHYEYKTIEYENIEKMIYETINKIEILESSLLKVKQFKS